MTDSGPETATGTGAVVLDRVRTDRRAQLGAVLAVLLGTVATFVALRAVLWVRVLSDLSRATPRGTAFVATTPAEVVLTQLVVSVLVGVLLAGEVLGYAARDALVHGGSEGRQWRREGLALVAVVLFPVGVVVGYEVLVPVVVGTLSAGGATRPVGWVVGLAFGTAAVTGLAAQAAVAACAWAVGTRAR